ncbi:hypothetical protein DICVIV_09934 [Dictyocaulus viviparus]|uniref:Uncharacterized protein n=1 Tax=Dictyocaulus viviparus TaxID=29172 RepID=A0A0D8XHA3_DICVI|nr:hypothetical protein DICVIV_09934 [Dictyocaulus viviparus]
MGSISAKPYLTCYEPRQQSHEIAGNYSKEYSQYCRTCKKNEESDYTMRKNTFVTNEDYLQSIPLNDEQINQYSYERKFLECDRLEGSQNLVLIDAYRISSRRSANRSVPHE